MKTNAIFTLLMAALMWATFLIPSPAQAQGLTSLLSADDKTSAGTEIDEVMRAAAENGVSVVVIDTNGTVLTEIGGAEPEAEKQDIGSTLMSIQDDAVAFRTALTDGFLNLPTSFNEVINILRATSPNGTIFAYFKVLFLSLLLLSVGMLFQNQVYGKRIAKRYVMGRIKDNPVGYGEKMPFLMFRFFMGLIGIVISMAVAFILGAIIFGPLENPALQFTATLIYVGYFLVRVVISIWRMILSPFLTQYRIPLLTDSEAKRLFSWLCVGTTLGISTILFGVWIRELGLNFPPIGDKPPASSRSASANLLMIFSPEF